MKRLVTIILAAAALLSGFSVSSYACTNLVVGKNASTDGSVMCSYNRDGYGFSASLIFYRPGRHEPGEMFPVYRRRPQPRTLYVPQAEYTYGVAGLMNEKQVSIVETTWVGRTELKNPEGILDYYTMMQIALQRSATAREAIAVMHNLVQENGYCSTGESYMVCDKNEAWIMEMIGKGPGRKGAVWVALRVPDDCISAYANCSRIRQFPQAKKVDKKLGFCVVDGVCMYSKDAISFAREMGYFSGADKDFNWREAYCPISFEKVRYTDARVWSFFRHHVDPKIMDEYLPYINGDFDKCDALPLWVKPDAPLSYRDVQNDMRDHYEGTPLDMTTDMSAGPWASPVRNKPSSFEASDGTKMFRERPIGCPQSDATMVCRMRSWLPDAVGGICYFNLDDASTVAYVPVYCCLNTVPEAFLPENNNIREFSSKSAYWMCNFVSNMVYPRWSAMIGDLREAQKELEDFYEADQANVEEKVRDLSALERANYLTAKTSEYTSMMMDRWDRLAKLLIVKHNDQIMLKGEYGSYTNGQYDAPDYSPAFIDAIKAQTGDRYLMKK